MKQCSKCKEWKDKSEFSKDKRSKSGVQSACKKCGFNWRENNKKKLIKSKKIWRENNKEKIRIYRENNKDKIQKWRENNKDKIQKYKKDDYTKNKDKIQKYKKEYNNSPMPFNSKSKYRKEIELYEEIKESPDGNVMCKCAYCGEWFDPTRLQIVHRINAINNSNKGEVRLYCKEDCKQNCPVYCQHLYPKDMKPYTKREVQPELAEMVFERDNYTCQRCNTHRDNLEVNIVCHHIEGILWEPLQSADKDMCITFCEDCHKEVHKIPGCGYYEMQCAEQII